MGDIFLNRADNERLEEQIERFVELIFQHPFHTPRPEEIGMAEAFAAAGQSANLARVVGAAIQSQDNEIVAMGTNDVPRPGGGVYRAGVNPDNRDHTPHWRRDTSDENRRGIITDFLEHLLADPGWLSELDVCGEEGTEPGTELARLLELSEHDPPSDGTPSRTRAALVHYRDLTDKLSIPGSYAKARCLT